MGKDPFGTAQQPTSVSPERAAYSVREIAQQYGVSEPFVRLEIKRGNLRVSKLGRRIVIPIDSVVEWVTAGMSL